MKDYEGLDIKERTIQNVDIPVELIRSGDVFLIQKFQGLGPAIGWVMGTNTSYK